MTSLCSTAAPDWRIGQSKGRYRACTASILVVVVVCNTAVPRLVQFQLLLLVPHFVKFANQEMSTLPAGYISQRKVTSPSSRGSLDFIVCEVLCTMVLPCSIMHSISSVTNKQTRFCFLCGFSLLSIDYLKF